MADHKTALSSLSPLEWDDVPSSIPDLETYLKTAFSHAERILNSIPYTSSIDTTTTFTPNPANSAKGGIDTLCDASVLQLPPYPRDDATIKGHGKPYKLSAKDNPLGVNVYKSAAHDRRGAWFARRSVHQGLGFDKWRKCAQREFAESLGNEGGPGAGSVRGVRADRRVERRRVEGFGTIEVWQTSSAFGPVTPRESVTLVVTSTDALSPLPQTNKPPPRHFLLISRPLTHPSTPNRTGLVKMAYESAEMIREIPIEGNNDPESNPVEWLMITRSDPGGGIPKFMVERGTPGSIAADVVKFLDWATSKNEKELDEEIAEDDAEDAKRLAEPEESEDTEQRADAVDNEPNSVAPPQPEDHKSSPAAPTDAQPAQDQSYYTSLKAAAASYLPSSLNPNNTSTASLTPTSSSSSSDSSAASSSSFRSALSARHYSIASADPTLLANADAAGNPNTNNDPTSSTSPTDIPAAHPSLTTPQPTTQHKHSKEIAKLLAKRAALTDKHRADRAALAAKTREMREQAEGAQARVSVDNLSLSRFKSESQGKRSSQSSLLGLGGSGDGDSGKATAVDDAAGGGGAAAQTGDANTSPRSSRDGGKATQTSRDGGNDDVANLSIKSTTTTPSTTKEAKAVAARFAKETKVRSKEASDKQKALARAERDAQKREERYAAEIVKLDNKRLKEEKRESERAAKRREKEEKEKNDVGSLKVRVGKLEAERDEYKKRAEEAERRLEEMVKKNDEAAPNVV